MRRDRDTKEKERSEISARLEGKKSKEEVAYRAKNPGSKESCEECKHYLNPGEDSSNCKIVAGLVYAEDTCDLFDSRVKENKVEGQDSDRAQPIVVNIEVQINAARRRASGSRKS